MTSPSHEAAAQVKFLNSFRMCRICHEGSGRLIRPCNCRGTLQYVHPSCIQVWIRHRQPGASVKCEICREKFLHVYKNPSPLCFLFSSGSWRRWIHIGYIVFVAKRLVPVAVFFLYTCGCAGVLRNALYPLFLGMFRCLQSYLLCV